MCMYQNIYDMAHKTRVKKNSSHFSEHTKKIDEVLKK